MEKVIGKKFPHFDRAEFFTAEYDDDHSCREELLPPIPSKFSSVHFRRGVSQEQEHFIAFNCGVEFYSGENTDVEQDENTPFLIYPDQMEITTPHQLKGDLPRGVVDFYVSRVGCPSLSPDEALYDPDTGNLVRVPLRIGTYFPVRNALILKNLTGSSDIRGTLPLIEWIFQQTDKIGYKITKRGVELQLGCDPEFLIYDLDDNQISASSLFSGGLSGELGNDGRGSTAELRPPPQTCPLALTEEVRRILKTAAKELGNDKKVTTGGGYENPIGYHVHFNKNLSPPEIHLLDTFLGGPSQNIEGGKRPSGGYHRLGRKAVRRQPHGCEYRPVPSVLLPELVTAVHVVAYCCVHWWEVSAEESELRIQVDDVTEIPTLESYLQLDLSPDGKWKPHLEEFWKWCNRIDGRRIDKKQDFLWRWLEDREEVKPQPGLRITWSLHRFERMEKPKFLSVPELEKICSVIVFTFPDPREKKIVRIFLPEELEAKKDTVACKEIKKKYNLDKFGGRYDDEIRIGLSEPLVDSLPLKKVLELVQNIATATLR